MYQELLQIYIDNNFYKEHLIALVKKGMDGAQKIAQMMVDLRATPVSEIDGSKVKYVCDYQASTQTNLITGEVETIDVPKSNVLIFHTEDGTKVAARPSGTEPKIKFYFSVKESLDSLENASKVEASLDALNKPDHKTFFSFEWGDATFVILDPYSYNQQWPVTCEESFTLGVEQALWFKKILANSSSTWMFVFMHQTGASQENLYWNYKDVARCYGRGGVEKALMASESAAIYPLLEEMSRRENIIV